MSLALKDIFRPTALIAIALTSVLLFALRSQWAWAFAMATGVFYILSGISAKRWPNSFKIILCIAGFAMMALSIVSWFDVISGSTEITTWES